MGPGSYNAVNSFGKQCLAGKQTVSSFSFGAPTQKDGRGYVVGTQIRSETPGPGQYRSPGAVGPQAVSSKNSAPHYGFGTNTQRMGDRKSEHIQAFCGSNKPHSPRQAVDLNGKVISECTAAPGSYNLPTAIGKQIEGVRPTTASYSFGSRLKPLKGNTEVPGPGMYESHIQSVGAQASSKKRTSPQPKFGTAQRFRSNVPVNTVPGPGAYGAKSSMGHQTRANNPTSPRAKFGTALREDRSLLHTRGKPGPGQYATHLNTSMGESRVRKQSPRYGFGTSSRQGMLPYQAPQTQVNGR